MASINGDQITIDSRDNGELIKSGIVSSFTGITAKWNGTAAPAGTLTFTVDGEAGENNVMDLGAGQRTIGATMQTDSGATPFPLRFVDIAVSGIPAGGSVTLYFG